MAQKSNKMKVLKPENVEIETKVEVEAEAETKEQQLSIVKNIEEAIKVLNVEKENVTSFMIVATVGNNRLLSVQGDPKLLEIALNEMINIQPNVSVIMLNAISKYIVNTVKSNKN